MNVEILGQFASPPVPNLPALAMAMAPVMHQQPIMTQPPVSMPVPSQAATGMTMTPAAQAQPPTNTSFIASFPPAQVTAAILALCVFPSTFLINVFVRPPNLKTMSSRTSRRLRRRGQEIPLSAISRGNREEVSLKLLHFNTKTGVTCYQLTNQLSLSY